ncbi:hypothetical protein BHM03_00061727 [Ensete ventricosum]|nr:hypothetical protein BHM03_00061727 [Ensete ventricosum]
MFTAWYGRYIPVCQVAAVATRGRSFSRTGRKIKATGKIRTARYIPVRQLTEIDCRRSIEEEKGKKKKKKRRRSTSHRRSGDSAKGVAREPSPPALP